MRLRLSKSRSLTLYSYNQIRGHMSSTLRWREVMSCQRTWIAVPDCGYLGVVEETLQIRWTDIILPLRKRQILKTQEDLPLSLAVVAKVNSGWQDNVDEGSLSEPFSPYTTNMRAVFSLSAQSQTCYQWVLDSAMDAPTLLSPGAPWDLFMNNTNRIPRCIWGE